MVVTVVISLSRRIVTGSVRALYLQRVSEVSDVTRTDGHTHTHTRTDRIRQTDRILGEKGGEN